MHAYICPERNLVLVIQWSNDTARNQRQLWYTNVALAAVQTTAVQSS